MFALPLGHLSSGDRQGKQAIHSILSQIRYQDAILQIIKHKEVKLTKVTQEEIAKPKTVRCVLIITRYNYNNTYNNKYLPSAYWKPGPVLSTFTHGCTL